MRTFNCVLIFLLILVTNAYGAGKASLAAAGPSAPEFINQQFEALNGSGGSIAIEYVKFEKSEAQGKYDKILTNPIIEQCRKKSEKAIIDCLNIYRSESLKSAGIVSDMKTQILLDKKSAVDLSMYLHKGITAASSGYSLVVTKCETLENLCATSCYDRKNEIQNFTEDSERVPDEEKNTNAKQLVDTITNYCTLQIKDIKSLAARAQSDAKTIADSAAVTADSLKTYSLLGAAAVGGGALLYNKKKEKDEEKKEDDAKKKDEEGIIIGADGKEIKCIDADNFLKLECQKSLLKYCDNTKNAGKVGCAAFQTNFCSSADGTQTHCLAKDAGIFCKQTGDVIQNSPACKWVSERPAECGTDPKNINCYSKMTAQQLTNECPKYPHDPLCKAHKSGIMVTQPTSNVASSGDGTGSSASDSATTDATNDQSSLSTLVSGQNQTANDNSGSFVSLSSNTNPPDANLFDVNSQAIQTVCARGDLTNCSSGSSK